MPTKRQLKRLYNHAFYEKSVQLTNRSKKTSSLKSDVGQQSQLDDKRGFKKNYWKKYSKDYYIKHNEILKRTRHSKYAENPSPVKKRMRLNYSKNQSPVRNRMRLSYSEKEFRYDNNVQNDDKLLEEKLMSNHSELGIDPPIKLTDDLRKPNEIAKANLTNYITTEQYKEPLTKKLSTEKKNTIE